MAELKDAENIPEILLPCTTCGRTFRPEALSKHSKICEKTMKKRKTFDSSKQRLQGTDLEAYSSLTPLKGKSKDQTSVTTKSSPAKWKEKHADLTRTLQMAVRKVETSATVKPSDHQQCPFCERFFGPKAYERHVDWCKGQQLKFKKNSTNIEARERLQVRTGYRAPLPNKVLTRDKYQPGGLRSRDPSLTKADLTKPKVNDPVNRSQTFSISKSTVKTNVPERRSSQTKINTVSPKIKKKVVTESKISSSSSTTFQSNKNVSAPKILSNTRSGKSDIDKYDPFASAEQQMMELFNTDRRQLENSNNNKNNNINQQQQSVQQISQTNLLQSSSKSSTPTTSPPPPSAFAVYNRKTNSSESLTLDNKENDNHNNNNNNNNKDDDEEDDIIITDNQSNIDIIGVGSPLPIINRRELDEIDEQLILSALESCSIVSIDSIDCNKNASLVADKYFRSNSDYGQRHKSIAGDCGNASKSNSAGSGGRSSNKYKVNMQQMLFGDSPLPASLSNNITSNNDKTSKETDISAETVNLLEECEAELMLELEKMLNASTPTTPPKSIPSPTTGTSYQHLPTSQSSFPVCSSDEQPESVDNKESGDKKSMGHAIDSAYSSLTRVLSEGDSTKAEQSRFCHECGTQYPVALAKFCCYCGMRRIAI